MGMDSSNERVILGEELMELVRERVAAGQVVRYLPFRGVSMLPMLRQGIDTVELAPLPEKLRRYDLPVYRYPSGKYVMHRVIRVEEDHYVCMGDNTYQEEFIRKEQMIALVSAFRRGEKRISVEDTGYRRYCRWWVALYPVRKIAKRVGHVLRWPLRKIKACLRRILK